MPKKECGENKLKIKYRFRNQTRVEGQIGVWATRELNLARHYCHSSYKYC